MDIWFFILLCILIWLLPLPFGGNIESAVFGFEASVFVLFLVFLIGQIKRKENQKTLSSSEKTVPLFVIILISIFFLTGFIQILPLPSSLIKILSPAAWQWRQVLISTGLFENSTFDTQTVSLSPWASAYEFIKYLAFAAFVFLLSKSVNTIKKAQALALVLISAGVFQSFYGLSEYFGGTNRIFTWVNRYYSGSAFGTFVNRDHYSAFLEMVFPLSLGYFLVRADYFALKPGLSLRQKIASFGQEKIQKSIIFILPPIIIGIGLLFSRCRSGIIIFVVTFFLTLLLLSLAGVTGRRKTEKSLVKVVIFVVILSVILIGIEPILERFTYGGFFDRNRILFYTYTVNLMADYPLTGAGLGTYVQAINPYLQKDFYVILNHAHNDYLEMLAEAGFIGGGSLILAGFMALGLACRRWLKAVDPLGRGIGLGAMMGVFSLFFHSLTDFSLRMPGNAIMWLSLFILCLKVPLLTRKKSEVLV
jgi:O-antigen ligase